MHLRARYYQPAVGRFFQVDPWDGDPNRPQTFNPYGYVGNNPANLTDASGRCYPPLDWLRHVPPDDVLCGYMDMAAFITGAPMATRGEKALAWTYIGGWALAHSLLIVAAGFYAAGTAIAAAEVAPAIGAWALEGIVGAKTFGEATTLIATTLASSSFLEALGIGGELYLTYQAVVCGNEDAAAVLISGFLLTGQSLVQNGLQRGVTRILDQFRAASQVVVNWPSQPHGVPEHWARIQQEVQSLSQQGLYEEIWVNMSLSTATGGEVSSMLRPDLIARTPDGRYLIVEMISPSQTFTQLLNKVNSIRALLGDSFLGWAVIQP